MNPAALTMFEFLTQDVEEGARRISIDKEVLNTIGQSELIQLNEMLNQLAPATDEARRIRNRAKTLITDRLSAMRQNSELEGSLINAPSRYEILQAGQKIMRQTVVLELHIKGRGFSKSVNSSDFLEKHGNAGDVNPTFLRVSLETIDRDYLIDLHNHTAKFKEWLKSRCVPSKILAPGFYLVPLTLLEAVDERLIEFVKERNRLLDAFEANYEQIKAEAIDNLGINYSEDYYPDFADIRSCFIVESQLLSFNVEKAIQEVNKEIYERELEKAQIKWSDTFQEVRAALRTGFTDLVATFANKLGRDESTGKFKIFHAQRAEDLKDFLSTFEARNLSGDVELAQLALDARKIVEGADVVDRIRSDEQFREELANQFQAIKDKAEGLVVQKGRQFNLEATA